MDLTLKSGLYYTDLEMQQLFRWVSTATLFGLLAAYVLISLNRHMLLLMQQQGGAYRGEMRGPSGGLLVGLMTGKGAQQQRDKEMEHKHLVSRSCTHSCRRVGVLACRVAGEGSRKQR